MPLNAETAKKRKRKPDTGHTSNCTKKSLYFENSQLADVDSLIFRLNEAGMTVTFTSIVRRALADYLTKQTAGGDSLFS